MTRYQRAKRFAFWRGLFVALALFTGLLVAISYGGQITAEQPATSYTRQR